MNDPQPNPEVCAVSTQQRIELPADPDYLSELIDSLRIQVRMAADKEGITAFDDGESMLVQVTMQGLKEREL